MSGEPGQPQLLVCWAKARQGDLSAVDRVLRIMERRARHHLAAAGTLSGDALLVGSHAFAIGDEVLALRNHRHLGVLNGTMARVVAIDQENRSLHVETAGRQTTLPAAYLDAGHLAHSYAMTIHKLQGATVDAAFLLGDVGLFREAGYVGMSRGRTANSCTGSRSSPAPKGAITKRRVPGVARLDRDLDRSAALVAARKAAQRSSPRHTGGLGW